MERFILRVLVLVLLGTTIGGFAASCSHVMLHLPEQNPGPANAAAQPTTGASGATQAAAPATGAPAATATTGAPGQTGATTASARPEDKWFITEEQAKALHDKGVIFIDARTFIEYTEGHVQGAMHCDKKYFDGAAPKKILDYLPGQEVVVYCHGAECTDSEAVVKRLIALNLQIGPYHIIKDGYPGWVENNKTDPKGYPIATGGEVGFQ